MVSLMITWRRPSTCLISGRNCLLFGVPDTLPPSEPFRASAGDSWDYRVDTMLNGDSQAW